MDWFLYDIGLRHERVNPPDTNAVADRRLTKEDDCKS